MSSLRLSFTMESREETEKILQEFTDVYFYGSQPLEESLPKDILKEEPNRDI